MRVHTGFLACMSISSQPLIALQALAFKSFTLAPSTCSLLSSHILPHCRLWRTGHL